MPSVRAALCSRFILIKCLSFVGVCSCSTSCSVNVFDEPEPLSASPDDDEWERQRESENNMINASGLATLLVPRPLTWWLHWWTMHQHGITMSHHQLLLLTICLTKYGQIGEYHNGAGYPKWYWTRYDGIVFINNKCALLGMLCNETHVLLRCIPANKDGQEREQCRRYPCI